MVIDRYRPQGTSEQACAFARQLVRAAAPTGPARAAKLLWVASRLASWAQAVGLACRAEVVLHPSVIERFVAVGLSQLSDQSRRTARAELRYLARRLTPQLVPPAPQPLPRGRAKAPYDPAEVAAYFGLAAAQPTQRRRHRLTALLCLGLGAGIEAADLRHLRGSDIGRRAGGVVVTVSGRRARRVPVLARYGEALLAAAAHAGEGFVCGGESATRKNLTTPLLEGIAGGAELPRLEVSRLRCTWLAEQLGRLGVPALLAAAGVTHSQRVFDLAATLDPGNEADIIRRLS
ncbi:MAG: hypothetical protein NAOJABEB_03012 [Steroidobacteraceae bacterium]|nr:hypothetical protein [Steroidobacteraceae bacterium]